MTASVLPRKWTQILCVAHALLVTTLWYAMFMLDKNIAKAGTWTTLAVLWSLWIFSVAFPGRTRRLRWVAILAICAFILSPTFSTLYSFAVWSVGGFAP